MARKFSNFSLKINPYGDQEKKSELVKEHNGIIFSVNLKCFMMVLEVYLQVCHSYTNLVHGIVLQEQWIWPMHDILFQSQKAVQSGRLTRCVRELCRLCAA